MRIHITVTYIASGGAGTKNHFKDVLYKTESSGALAASVFHKNIINICELKDFLQKEPIYIRY